MSAGIELPRVYASLRKKKETGTVTGREFMVCMHAELKNKKNGIGSAQGLPEFVMGNKQHFRRVDTLLEAMETVTA